MLLYITLSEEVRNTCNTSNILLHIKKMRGAGWALHRFLVSIELHLVEDSNCNILIHHDGWYLSKS